MFAVTAGVDVEPGTSRWMQLPVNPNARELAGVRGDALSASSGFCCTTGHPKGATLTHYNIVNNARFVVKAMRLTAQDRLVVCTGAAVPHRDARYFLSLSRSAFENAAATADRRATADS